MVELTSYGLTGLIAMLVMAFCFACGDELPSTREKSRYDLNNAHMNDSPMIKTGTGNPGFRETVGEQQKTIPSSLMRIASSAETASGAIYDGSLQSDRRQAVAAHD
jgi:hypothetical protein